jgi:hypothetical protein
VKGLSFRLTVMVGCIVLLAVVAVSLAAYLSGRIGHGQNTWRPRVEEIRQMASLYVPSRRVLRRERGPRSR